MKYKDITKGKNKERVEWSNKVGWINKINK